MTTKRTLLTTTFAILGLTLASSTAMANYRHIDEVALRLQKQSGVLKLEVREHLRYSPYFEHLMSDATEMNRLAAHMHKIAHRNGDLAHLRSDTVAMTKSLRHFRAMLDRVDYASRFTRRGYGHVAFDRGVGHGYGHGPVHGKKKADTAHLRQVVRSMMGTVTHLQRDIDELISQTSCSRPGHGDGYGQSAYNTPYNGYGIRFGNNSGLYYNGNRWAFRFGW